MANAPICYVKPLTPAASAPNIKLTGVIPPTPTIAGLMASVAALNNIVSLTSGLLAKSGGVNVAGGSGKTVGRWVELPGSRVTATVRIYNPSDKTQYIDVLRINQLTMGDSITGEKWIWNRAATGDPSGQ
jgi:hypothetical protein